MGHGTSPVSHQTAAGLADPSGSLWVGLADRRGAAVAERPQGRSRGEAGVGGVADALPGAVSPRASADAATAFSRLAGAAWRRARGVLCGLHRFECRFK